MTDYIKLIREYMRKNHKTQEQMSKMLGVNRNNLAAWLVGRRGMNVENYLKVAAFFGNEEGGNE